MKTLRILLSSICIFLSSTILAYDFEVDGLYYNINSSSTVFLTDNGVNSYVGDIVIPANVKYNGNDYSVIGISEGAFTGCSNVTTLRIPSTVTSIQADFDSMTSLYCISVDKENSSFESIDGILYGNGALIRCPLAKEGKVLVDNSDKYYYIGGNAFKGCVKISSVEIPERYTGIGNSAFEDCKWITSILLPESMCQIGEYCFKNCSSLRSIVIPDNVDYFDGYETFYGCESLENVKLSKQTSELYFQTFYNCISLEHITIPASVKSIGYESFRGCSNLKSVDIEYGCESIEYAAFSQCENLSSVILPYSLKKLGGDAFRECSSLTKVLIPESIEEIGDACFEMCGLMELNININKIPYLGFAQCKLTKIELGSKVEIIEDQAFESNHNLTEVRLNEGLRILGNSVFYGCESLSEIDLPTSLESFGKACFSLTSFKKIYIPQNVKSLSVGTTFPYTLSSINVDPANNYYKSIDGVLYTKSMDSVLCYPCCKTANTFEFPNTIRCIGEHAFFKAKIPDFVIPETIVSIGEFAFESFESNKVVVPEKIDVIRNFTFWGAKIVSIVLPTGVKSIGDRAFGDLEETKSIEVNALIPPIADSQSFLRSNMTVYVKENCLDLYRSADVWKDLNLRAIGDTTSDDPTPSDPSESFDVEASTDLSVYPNVLYFNDVENKVGDFNLELNMKCAEESITAFQCDVYLPEGVEWKHTVDKRGKVVYDQPTFNEDRTDESYHSISPIALNADGSYRMIVYSMANEIILETDGAILTLPLSISEEMEAGDYNLIIKGIVVTDVNKQQTLVDKVVSRLTIPSYTLGDVNGDDMINVTDVVSVIAYILGDHSSDFIFPAGDINEDGVINVTDVVSIIDIILNSHADPAAAKLMAVRKTLASGDTSNLEIIPFAIAEGTSSSTVKLNLNNPGDDFTAFQCDIQLPEGIDWENTVDKRGNVKYTTPVFDSEADRTDASYHTVSVQKTDGIFRVIVYSMANETILGEEGAVLDIPFVYADDIASGVYDVSIKNVVLTRVNKTDVKPADYTFSVLVGSPAESAIALNGNFTDEAINEFNTALAANTTVAAIDLSNAVNVSNNIAFATGNKNLVLYVAESADVKNSNNVVIGEECANLLLTDGYDFAAPKAFTATAASYERALAAEWCTLMLPYAVSSSDAVQYYTLSDVDVVNGVLTFEETAAVEANTPVVFKATGSILAANASNVEVPVCAGVVAGDAVNGLTLTGTLSKTTLSGLDPEAPTGVYYIKDNKFWRGNGMLNIPAFRAYFDAAVAGAKMLSISGDATGINSIKADANAKVYTIDGKQMSNDVKALPAGMYIVNDKKVIIKK